MRVFEELRQRKVLQTAALYFAVAWGITEVLSFLVERIPVFPAWTETAIAILFVLGFPVAVFLAWMFDLGGQGVRRADPASGLGKGVIAVSFIGLLALTGVLSYLLLPKIEAEHGYVHKGDLGTVAVLPFQNLTGDPSLGYLGAGLAEDIRQRLSLQTDLAVIGRVSIAGFSGTGTDLASVRGLLNAGLVVEGTLQRPAGRLQVNVSLLDTKTGKQVWSNSFNAEETGWGPLHRRIVTALAEQMAVTVRLKEQAAPVTDEALEAYLRGLAELSRPEVADGWFDEATRAAPDFADAWARKALLRVDMVWHGQAGQQAWEEAQPLLARTREIEPENLIADIAEAQLQWLAAYDPIASYETLQRAEERAPNDPMVLGGLATVLRYVPGKLEEAEAYGWRYLAQDPLNPDAHNILGTTLTFQHKYEEGFPHYDRAEELDPGYLLTYEYRANQEFFKKSPAEALATLTRRAKVEGGASEETVRCMLYIAGQLLPAERAIPLLREAVSQGEGMTKFHAWCPNPLDNLIQRLSDAGLEGEVDTARKELERFVRAGGDSSEFWVPGIGIDEAASCEDRDCSIRVALDKGPLAAWLGPDPPVSAFSGELAVDIVRILTADGRGEEGRALAAKVAPIVREYAGPKGHPSISDSAVMLTALSGDIDGALDYAELIGPGGFYLFGKNLGAWADYIGVPELTSTPRWAAFAEQSSALLQEEIEKFDRMVATGQIVMPFPVPGSGPDLGLD